MLSADDLKKIRGIILEVVTAENGPIIGRLDIQGKRLNRVEGKVDTLAEQNEADHQRIIEQNQKEYKEMRKQSERDHNEIIDKLCTIDEAQDQERKALEKRVGELEVHAGLKPQRN